jgi:hypothetical protein
MNVTIPVEQEEAFQEPEGYRIDDAEELAFAMRVIRDAKSRIDEETLTAEKLRRKLLEELELVDQHVERITKADRERIAYYEAQAVEHLRRRQAEDGRVKSLPTPFGTVSSRVQQPEFQRDETVLELWAALSGNPAYIRVKHEVNWSAIKAACHVRGDKLVTDDGEIVSGVTVVDREPTYRVDTVGS